MTRRRKRVVFRTVSDRIELWDKKLEASTYATYLERVKPLALRLFAEYQVVHEQLIKIVKDVTAKYPDEYAKQHAYMWYAQGIWYCRQRYRDEALQREVDALFVYWYMLGLKEEPMREIANRLGVKISSWEELSARLPMSEKVIYEGVKKALAEVFTGVPIHDTVHEIKYDPQTGNPVEIIITDKLTGARKRIVIQYDALGNPIKLETQTL